MSRIHHCRFCEGALSIGFCDLGVMPLANSYPATPQAAQAEPRFPLEARVCERCWLVQLAWVADAQAIFSDYAYFSSYSSGWLKHAAGFCAEATQRFGLNTGSFVVEVASNDGYLLRNFVAAGVPCLGIEPAANVAAVAQAAGVDTEVRFFGEEAARDIVTRRGHADLVVANNVLAHVPDINDFAGGLAFLAGRRGIVSIEVPHLLQLVREVQFDTIYHEHYAYWSLHTMARVLAAHGLALFDVQRLPTHGGSLRVFAARRDHPLNQPSAALIALMEEEAHAGVATPEFYAGFQPRVAAILAGARQWLDAQAAAGRRVAGYGAAAKGNTFLNALGATAIELMCVADRNPAKQGRLLPGSHIPVVTPEALLAARPDRVLVLPWNLAAEVASELGAVRAWGGRFAVAVPALREFDA